MVHERMKVAVVGAGGWGTTLANLLAEKGVETSLWIREDEVYRQIRDERMNKVFLPGIRLSPDLRPARGYEEALAGKDLVVMAAPSHVFREVLQGLKPCLRPGMTILSVTKGIENETLMTMSEVVDELLPSEYKELHACLGGPSFAKEVSSKVPTAVTIACRDLGLAKALQRLFSTDFFRVYTSEDVVGVELCGALKNVIAIAAGIADGLEVGHNTRAALITRGLAEMTRLGLARGARPATFAGLAGMGDLVLTCTGDLSRNRSVGIKIGQGMRLQEITGSMAMVAEGVKTTRSAWNLAVKTDVQMPIVEQVYRVLYEEKKPREALRDLMTRDLKAEPEY